MFKDNVVITGECFNLFKDLLDDFQHQVIDLLNEDGYRYTITSANDKNHSQNSLHYKNKAIDVRIKDIGLKPEYRKILLEAIVVYLGSVYTEFVFILHLRDGKNHLHIQYGRDNIKSFDSAVGENKNVFLR